MLTLWPVSLQMHFLDAAEKSTTILIFYCRFSSHFSWNKKNIGRNRKFEELHVVCNVLQFLGPVSLLEHTDLGLLSSLKSKEWPCADQG
jgi:hypothetical protein